MQNHDLLTAARNVLWKLNHNYHDSTVFNGDKITPVGRYTGPAIIDRNDVVIRDLAAVIAEIEDNTTG